MIVRKDQAEKVGDGYALVHTGHGRSGYDRRGTCSLTKPTHFIGKRVTNPNTMTDTKHKTVRDIVHEQHTKPTRWDADTNHTDSVDAKMSIEEMVEKLAACRYTGNPKTYPSEENYKANLTIVLARCLQSHTSQQVEEAVRAERSRIYGRLAQMKSVYVTMDTGSALVALMGEDIIREEAPNHQD